MTAVDGVQAEIEHKLVKFLFQPDLDRHKCDRLVDQLKPRLNPFNLSLVKTNTFGQKFYKLPSSSLKHLK